MYWYVLGDIKINDMPEAKRQSLRYCLTMLNQSKVASIFGMACTSKTFILMLCVPEENNLMTYIEIAKVEISNVDKFAHFFCHNEESSVTVESIIV